MQFFKIEAKTVNTPELSDRSARLEFAREVCIRLESFYFSNKQKVFMFVSSIRGNRIIFGAILAKALDLAKITDAFCKHIKIECTKTEISEVTLNTFEALIRTSEQSDFMTVDQEVLEMFDLQELSGFRRRNSTNYAEHMLDEPPDKQSLLKRAQSFLFGDALIAELERIYSGAVGQRGSGHPVHYLIQTDDIEVRYEMIHILLSALYANKRIENKRYCSTSFSQFSSPPDRSSISLYKASSGGSVIVSYSQEESEESDMAKTGSDVIIRLCELIYRNRHDVLSVICLERSREKIKRTFMENLGNMTLIELSEETVQSEKARNYLRRLARKQKLTANKALLEQVSDAGRGYLASDLNKIFNDWYAGRLKRDVYPQYADIEPLNQNVRLRQACGSGVVSLDEMIGLSEAKTVIKQSLDFYKAQKLFKGLGMKNDRPAMHMVFTGNPGTAKTTVARLFAQIMRENGLLSVGDLYELGRADLVGKYVGWTAPKVRAKFTAAKGSVLFIDEAYSLVDDRDGLYGDEAISAIVQEMENRREDIVVIFAGYPDKMEQFLQKNPGLRSRIAFHVPFHDYNAQELWQITELMARNMSIRIDDEAQPKLMDMFAHALTGEDFGNGRYVRNLLEKARMKQASRLVSMDLKQVTDEVVTTLISEDFEEPALTHELRKVWKIGFGA
jgi:AAA+ superfamily predicted ATPase